MGKFRVICCICGSDKILEKSHKNVVESSEEGTIYNEGIQRKCIECSNESFVLVKTRFQKNNS